MVSKSDIKKQLIMGNYSKYDLAKALNSDPDTINTLCSRMVKKEELRIVEKGPKRLSIYGLPESEFLKNLKKVKLIELLDFLMTFFESNKEVILNNPENQEFLMDPDNIERFEFIMGVINYLSNGDEEELQQEENQ